MKPLIFILVGLLVFPGHIFSSSKEPHGAKVKLYQAGVKYRGELLAVTPDLIVIKEKKSEKILGFSIPDVEKVYVRKSKVLGGVMAGIALAALITGIALIAFPIKSDNLSGVLAGMIIAGVIVTGGIVLGVILGASGGILGSIFGWKKFKFGKMTVPERENALLKLLQYSLFGSGLPEELQAEMAVVAAGGGY